MSDKNSWPAWFYGPGGASQVFDSEADVPKGWVDHPSKAIVTPETTGSKPIVPKADPLPGTQLGTKSESGDQSNTLDAAGWPWDASMHSATKTQTNAGLWRMKVGVSRPEPKAGFPKPALDL